MAKVPTALAGLVVNVGEVHLDTLLSDWSWAAPEVLQPILVTAFGDVFARGHSGVIYFVDVVSGCIETVALGEAAFVSLLPELKFIDDFFFPCSVS